MLYLSGKVDQRLFDNPHIGLMRTPWISNLVDQPIAWAADTGCFTRPYDHEAYFNWLADKDRSTCLFATAPDVVADWDATVIAATPVLPLLRDIGYKAAIVLQNGCEEVPWDEVDAVFIGGDNAFKLGWQAYGLAVEAKRRGKWVHMGRVNSWRRAFKAASWGCDSIDGTYLAFGPDILLPRLERWMEILNNDNPPLR